MSAKSLLENFYNSDIANNEALVNDFFTKTVSYTGTAVTVLHF